MIKTCHSRAWTQREKTRMCHVKIKKAPDEAIDASLTVLQEVKLLRAN